MANLPKFHTDNKDLTLLQDKWTSQLNPILANPQVNGSILKSVSLISGTNVINHLLGRKLIGWTITRQRAAANIHDAQDSNQSPQLTLVLISDAPAVVDIGVF